MQILNMTDIIPLCKSRARARASWIVSSADEFLYKVIVKSRDWFDTVSSITTSQLSHLTPSCHTSSSQANKGNFLSSTIIVVEIFNHCDVSLDNTFVFCTSLDLKSSFHFAQHAYVGT